MEEIKAGVQKWGGSVGTVVGAVVGSWVGAAVVGMVVGSSGVTKRLHPQVRIVIKRIDVTAVSNRVEEGFFTVFTGNHNNSFETCEKLKPRI